MTNRIIVPGPSIGKAFRSTRDFFKDMLKRRVLIPFNLIEQVRSNPEFMYGLKHLKDGLRLQGIFRCDQYRNGILIAGGAPELPNTFTTEGMARLLNIIFGDVSKAAERIWYVGIFKNNVTPAVGNTASACLGAAGTYGECQDADYDDPATNKPSYVIATTAEANCSNTVSKAAFVMADALTVYGAFLSSEKAKTATSGYLMCAKKFAAARQVVEDDELYVTYNLSLTTS